MTKKHDIGDRLFQTGGKRRLSALASDCGTVGGWGCLGENGRREDGWKILMWKDRDTKNYEYEYVEKAGALVRHIPTGIMLTENQRFRPDNTSDLILTTSQPAFEVNTDGYGIGLRLVRPANLDGNWSVDVKCTSLVGNSLEQKFDLSYEELDEMDYDDFREIFGQPMLVRLVGEPNKSGKGVVSDPSYSPNTHGNVPWTSDLVDILISMIFIYKDHADFQDGELSKPDEIDFRPENLPKSLHKIAVNSSVRIWK